MALVTHLNIRDGEITPIKLSAGGKYSLSGLTACMIVIGSGSQTDPPRGCLNIRTPDSLSAYFESEQSGGVTEVAINGPISNWHIKNDDANNGSLSFKEINSGNILLCGTSGGVLCIPGTLCAASVSAGNTIWNLSGADIFYCAGPVTVGSTNTNIDSNLLYVEKLAGATSIGLKGQVTAAAVAGSIKMYGCDDAAARTQLATISYCPTSVAAGAECSSVLIQNKVAGSLVTGLLITPTVVCTPKIICTTGAIVAGGVITSSNNICATQCLCAVGILYAGGTVCTKATGGTQNQMAGCLLVHGLTTICNGVTITGTLGAGATTVTSLNASDGNITNVGQIDVDSIVADDASDITMTFASGKVVVSGAATPFLQVQDSTSPATLSMLADNSTGIVRTETAHNLLLGTNTATQMTFVSGGTVYTASGTNFGVGGVPTATFHVQGGTTPRIRVEDTTTPVAVELLADNSVGYVQTQTNHPLVFRVSESEKMRIDSAGDVYVGGSNTGGSSGYGKLNAMGNNGNASFTQLSIINNDATSAAETSQTASAVFSFSDNVSGIYQGARIEAYKAQDWVGNLNADAGLKFYTVNRDASFLPVVPDVVAMQLTEAADVLFPNGNVGIGVTPSTKLHLYDASNPTIRLEDSTYASRWIDIGYEADGGGEPHLVFSINQGAGAVGKMWIQNDGIISTRATYTGLTTDGFWLDPGNFLANAVTSTNSAIYAVQNGTGKIFSGFDAGSEVFYVDDGGDGYFAGNVGIGEASPLGTVHIKTSDAGAIAPSAGEDDLVLENSGAVGMSIYGGTTSTGTIRWGDSTDDGLGFLRYHYSSHATLANNMQFFTVGVDRMTIDSAGNVGIGTATPVTFASWSDPVANRKFNVTHSAGTARLMAQGSVGATLDLADTGGGVDDKWLNLTVDGGVGVFKTINDAGTALIADNILVMDLGTGNVGIGTSSPSSLLHLAGNNANAQWTGLRIENSDWTSSSETSQTSDIDFYFTDNVGGSYIGSRIGAYKTADWVGNPDYDAGLAFWTIDQNAGFTDVLTKRMTIDNAGNVGIGTSSPTYPLQVQPSAVGGASVGTGLLALVGAHNTTRRPYIYFINETAGTTYTGGMRWIDGNGTEGWAIENNRLLGISYLEFNLAGVNKFVIDPSGNVGIGTSSFTNAFAVEKSIVGDYVAEFHNDNATAGTSYGVRIHAGTNASDSAFDVVDQTNSTNYFSVRGDGQVSILAGNVCVPLCIVSGVTVSGVCVIGSTAVCGATLCAGTTVYSAGVICSEACVASPYVITGCLCTTANLCVGGTLGKAAGSFVINHPCCCKEKPNEYNNKNLLHGFEEGPKYGIFYEGEALLNEGRVDIKLPEYFDKLVNRNDGIYIQLTPIGKHSNIFVAEIDECIVCGNNFTVCSDKKISAKFSWRLSAARGDDYVVADTTQTDDLGRLCIVMEKAER